MNVETAAVVSRTETALEMAAFTIHGGSANGAGTVVTAIAACS